MSKYVYAEATVDFYPSIKTVVANSYHDAVEKVIKQYSDEFEEVTDLIDNWDDLRETLNTHYSVDLSDLEDYEEL